MGLDLVPANGGEPRFLGIAIRACRRVVARLEARVCDPRVGGTPRARGADVGKRSLSGHIPDPG